MSIVDELRNSNFTIASLTPQICTVLGIIALVFTYGLTQSLILGIGIFFLTVLVSLYVLQQNINGCIFCGTPLANAGQFCVKCGRPQN